MLAQLSAMLNHLKLSLLLFICLSFLGCTTAEQRAKPLNREAVTSKIISKDPRSETFSHYLIKHGYVKESLPLDEWTLDSLTLSAVFYHTKLEVARKQLALANLATQAASVKKTPSINADIARSNQKNNDINPWAYGLSIDIPIQTTNKREARTNKARENAEAARMNVAETAWQLRNKIAVDLNTYYQNIAKARLLADQLALQKTIADILEKRVNAGIASKTELNNARLLTLKTKHALNTERAQLKLIKTKLATDVGLTPEKFASIQIKPLSLDEALMHQSKAITEPLRSKALQADALLNRIDIRRSIARYAAAEAEIKLQVANQTPDITLSPGVLFDFGDSIWSLGFSSLLNSLNKNTALIEQAKQLREIQGAEFEDLQAKIIAQLDQAQARYIAVQQIVQQAKEQQSKQLALMQKIQKQFDAGLIGKLELKQLSLNTLIAKQQVSASKFSLLAIANQIENIMQKPLYSSFKMTNLDK